MSRGTGDIELERQIAHDESVKATEAQRQAMGINDQIKSHGSGDSQTANSSAPNNAHAEVYGNVGLAALTGGSASVELFQMGTKILSEGMDTNNLGGMEKPVKPSDAPAKVAKDIVGQNVRSIQTPHSFSLTERKNALSGSFMGNDQTIGINADKEKTIVAFKGARDAANALQIKAEQKSGLSKRNASELAAQNHYAQNAPQPQGMGGGTANVNAPSQYAQSKGLHHTHDGPWNGPNFKEPVSEETGAA